MKSWIIVILWALIATFASPSPFQIQVSTSQFHSQDESGRTSFGYSFPGQAANNYRDASGKQVGSYVYVDPNGKEVRVAYVADEKGYRVTSNDLPVPPVAKLAIPVPATETPEVAAIRAALSARKKGDPVDIADLLRRFGSNDYSDTVKST